MVNKDRKTEVRAIIESVFSEAPMANAIDDVKLMPCPFCGGEVELQSSKTLGDRLFVIGCKSESPCLGSGLGIYVTQANLPEAISAWNRRASPAPSQHTGWSDEAVEASWQRAAETLLDPSTLEDVRSLAQAFVVGNGPNQRGKAKAVQDRPPIQARPAMTMENDLVERLTRDRDEALALVNYAEDISKTQDARIQALEAELARKTEALRPFANYFNEDHRDEDNKGNPLPAEQEIGWAYLTYAEFRAAREANKGDKK